MHKLKSYAIIVIILVSSFGFSGLLYNSFFVSSAVSHSPTTPIKHIVVIMQENHAFDNLFGAVNSSGYPVFPGLNASFAVNPKMCDPLNTKLKGSPCVYPFNADNMSLDVESQDLPHTWGSGHQQIDNGKMNGFYQAASKAKGPNPQYAMAFYTNYTVPNYWDLASYYALDANFFSSTFMNSYPNHLFMVAAQAGPSCTGPVCPVEFNYTFPTIINQLSADNISWRYYSGTWNDKLDCTNMSANTQPFSQAWIVLPDFPAFQQNPADCHNQLTLNDLFQNLSKGYLPSVTWITPNNANSDHPGGKSFGTPLAPLSTGQEYVSKIIDDISNNATLWNSTAIFLTWDDGGGYSDTFVPEAMPDLQSYGFRTPLIVISPFAERGVHYGPSCTTKSYLSCSQQDFTSLLSTIEYNWNLNSLTYRDLHNLQDSGGTGLFYMFNFTQSLTPPLILPYNSLATFPVNSCLTCKIGPIAQLPSVNGGLGSLGVAPLGAPATELTD